MIQESIVFLTAKISENLAFSDSLSSVHPNPRDVTGLFVMLIVGIIMLILLKRSDRFQKYHAEYDKFAKYKSELVPIETPYDDFQITKLEKIVNNLSNNYRILITIYGILFAFIVSDNLRLAFSSWPYIIWTGWTLAIIVRTGITALDLTDIIEITDNDPEKVKNTAKKINAYKSYFKHSLYLLVVAVAFLPMLYYTTGNNQDFSSVWESNYSVLAVAWGIIGVFIFVFFLVVRVSEFRYLRGVEGYYVFAFFLLVFGALSVISESPLKPELVTLFGITQNIPNILSITLYFGFFLGFVTVLGLGQALFAYFKNRYFQKNKNITPTN